ncbi:hypothetical protein Lesp02_03870 [Lentzea sp. NBRC 105346]|nr:hypothetical protein Lesp02_03870 [Lentzea sp. NBRC 105346]
MVSEAPVSRWPDLDQPPLQIVVFGLILYVGVIYLALGECPHVIGAGRWQDERVFPHGGRD